MTMPRALGKLLDTLARAFFGGMRGVAALTGRSLSVSVILLLAVAWAVDAALWRFAGRGAALAFIVVMLATLYRVTTVVKAYDEAFRARDFVEVTRIRSIIEGKGEPRSPGMRAIRRVGDGELLIEFEKWEEAAEALAAVELADVPAVARPGIVSQLGYARAHAGRVDRGVADVERALAEADAMESYPVGKRFHVVRRHGIALSLAGEHERAIEVLEPLSEYFEGNPREWAEAFYFLGRSYLAEEDTKGAMSALAKAVCGEGPFVARAWTELATFVEPANLKVLRETIAKEREPKN